jgi:hypothetical protein
MNQPPSTLINTLKRLHIRRVNRSTVAEIGFSGVNETAQTVNAVWATRNFFMFKVRYLCSMEIMQ